MVSIDDIKNNEDIKTYITQADQSLVALGFTEHSFADVYKRQFPDTAEIPVKLTDGGKLLMRGGRIDYSGTLDDGREYSGENGAMFADETSALNIEVGTVN